MYIYTYIHAYMHTYIHYITLHSLHYITLHYVTLHYIHYITLHYTTPHYITLHYIALHYVTLHYIHTYMFSRSALQLRLSHTSAAAHPEVVDYFNFRARTSMSEKVEKMALFGNAANLHLIHGTGWNGQGGTHPSRAMRKQFTITTTILSVE